MVAQPIVLGRWQLGQDYFGEAPYVPGPVVPRDRLRQLLAGHRQDDWHIELLARDEGPLGALQGIRAAGGYLDFSIHTAVRGGGRITHIREAGTPAVEWAQRRVQPWYHLDDPQTGTEFARWPLGVFLCSTPVTRHEDGYAITDVTLYDKLLILHRRSVSTTWTYDAGTNPVAAVRDLILACNETSMALTETDQTLADAMSWDPGTTYLQIANDLLQAANYFSLWCDGHGQFRATPNIPPNQRPRRWDFRDDAESIYVPGWTHEADDFNVPNHVVLVGRGDSDTPALTAEALNEDPDSPWSIPTVGYVSTHTEEGVDATDQPTLDALAQRRLTDLSQVTSSFEIAHAVLPDVTLNDAVLLANESHDTDALCVVQKQRVPLESGGLVTSTLREVTR